jgi:hypothetical protein
MRDPHGWSSLARSQLAKRLRVALVVGLLILLVLIIVLAVISEYPPAS